jgi:hypothetical protein
MQDFGGAIVRGDSPLGKGRSCFDDNPQLAASSGLRRKLHAASHLVRPREVYGYNLASR